MHDSEVCMHIDEDKILGANPLYFLAVIQVGTRQP